MINYADYNYYKNIYKGSLSDDLFTAFIPKASREIDKVVNRAITSEDLSNDKNNFGSKIKFTACEMVDFLNKYDNPDDKGPVNSISIDGVSKNYNSFTSTDLADKKNKIANGLPHELIRFL